MTLYKYVTAERIDVLQNGLIRFTQPSALNDPWDMRPHVERLIADNDLQRVTDPLVPRSEEQLVDYFSQIIEDFAKTKGVGDKSLDEIRQLVSEANTEFPGELRQLFEGAFVETLETMKQVVPQVVELIPEAMDKAVGVLSLTEKPDHQQWAYEEEWRMIKGLKQATKTVQAPTGNVHLFSVPPACIVSVVLGQRMVLETRRQVVEFIRTDKSYTHVTLFQAKSSSDKFTIEIQPI